MGIAVRLPFVLPKIRHLRLRRSGCNISAALVSTNDGLRAFGAQAVILQQPWYLPIICSSICCSNSSFNCSIKLFFLLFHTITHSHYHTFTLLHSHIFTLSQSHTITLSHFHSFTFSPFSFSTLSL